MKLLVTGGAGYLGSEVCRQAVERGFEVLAGRHRLPPPYGRPVRLEIRDEHATARVLMRHGPEAVVHTAYRQEAEELADTVVRGSRSVALAAARSGARLVQLSTDLVFDGEHGAPYDEAAEPRPVSAYGAAKLEAERLVARAHPEALLVRTSLLYGKARPAGEAEPTGEAEPGPQERLALAPVSFYTDEIRCPTLVAELAAALLELVALDAVGPLHVAAPEPVSRYELARLLRAARGLDPDTVHGAPSPGGDRPRNVALDSSRAAGMLAQPLHGVSEALERPGRPG